MQDTLSLFEYSAEELSAADIAAAAELSEKRLDFEEEKAARRIFEEKDIKIVLLSGPSASGKTSVARLICEKVGALGKKAVRVSLDDFFIGISALPLLSDGTYDMESIKGLDTELANECFARLLRNGRAELPTFDFPAQCRSDITSRVDIGKSGIVLVEGIHALSPALTENLPPESVLRIYTEPRTRYSAGGKTALLPEDVRFARRMIRDELFRAWSAEKTFAQWKSVLDGEKIYIDPYRASAELELDSSLLYEPAVFKGTVREFLGRIPPNSEFFEKAQAFLEKFEAFQEASPEIIPKNSILREFVG